MTELFDKMEEYARAEEDSTRRTPAAPAHTPAAPTAAAAGAPVKPRTNDYKQKGRGVYHVDGGPPPEGAKQATRGRRGRSRGRGRPDNRQPDGRAATGRPLFCDFHGEGSHTTSECRTIPAMMHYMGQNRQQAQRNDGGGAGNQPRIGNQPRAGNQLPAPID